jgi:hypothetical protein
MIALNCGPNSARRLLMGGTAWVALACANPAFADDAALLERLSRLEAQVAAQARQLAAQEVRLDDQERMIESQRLEARSLHAERDEMLATIRAGAAVALSQDLGGAEVKLAQNSQSGIGPTSEELAPARPVGDAPPKEVRQAREVTAVPEFASVLTPKGHLVVDPSVEYNRSSSNRLVFRGVEIVPGINLGLLEANDADRDAAVATISGRYGLSRRVEVQASVPYVYRHDRITTVATPNDSTSRKTVLDGQGLGDVEIAARYQFNSPKPGLPFLVGNLRVKPPTGEGPYDVSYDEFGVAKELAVGSGFWGVEAGVTAILPTDPAVIFGSLSYLYNVPDDINKFYGSGKNAVYVGRVDPGDSISASLGFGLALNPRFSFSLGYAHAYYFRSNSQIGQGPNSLTRQPTEPLQVGTLNMGLSYRLTNRITVNNNFQFGVTSDAPDMRVVMRVPYSF